MQRIAWGAIGTAEGADVVFAAIAEGGIVCTEDIFAIADSVCAVLSVLLVLDVVVEAFFLLALKVNCIEVGIDCAALVAAEIDFLVFLVDTADIDNIVVASSDLTNQLAVHTIEVNMVVAVTLACDEERLAIGQEAPSVGHLDVGLVLFGVERTNLARRGVGSQQLHTVLQTVHTHKSQNVGIFGPLHTRQVLVVLATRFQTHGRAVLEAVYVDINHRVVLAGLGILVVVIVGIETAPSLHRELAHTAFVEAVIGDALRVGAPVEALRDGKLLFIHPVGGAVDNGVHTTVRGDLMLFLRVKIHVEQIVVAHVGHLGAIGRERRQALFAFVAYFGEGAIGYIIYIVVRHTAVAIDRFETTAEKYLLFVGREFIVLDWGQRFGFLGHCRTSERTYHTLTFASFVRILFDSGARQHTVVFAVLHRADALYATRREGTLGPNIFKSYLFCRLCYSDVHSCKH